MDMLFKNITVGYIPDAEVTIKDKKYLIHDVINGEDILVDTSLKYPALKEVVKKSPVRVDYKPEECGGCDFMHVTYDYELELKKKYINNLFKPFHVGEIDITPMLNPTHYRNKSQMTYKLSKSKKITCGLYEEFSHNVITAENNILQCEKANKIIFALNKILTKHKITVYDEKSRTGVLRHVFVRYGFNSNELMLVLVTNGEMFPGRNNVLTDLKKLDLGITTVVQNFNSRDTSIVLGDKERVLYGPGFIYETIAGYKFKISPRSFFQVNTTGMELLYNKAIEMANLNKKDIVIDAYCGVGTISIFLSKHVKHVYGVELNKAAVADAKINQKINNINNIEFVADDATNYMTHLAKNRETVDVVFMDPPRDGSTKQFINAIKYMKAKKVVYISCNPETLKRDLYLLAENGYSVKKIHTVDMFPRTLHTENIAILEFNEGKAKNAPRVIIDEEDDEELAFLQKLVDEQKKSNTKEYNKNKMRTIPKADIEMMREDQYERTGSIPKKKYKKY